ncbi:MAG: hypothetical protein IPF62_12100 [Bacteroidetes bacterium]|nr:hypothetical protein [Bacteroidota bacterium]
MIENDVEDYANELNDNSDEKIDLSNTKNDKAKKTITSERKKHVEQHHAWKAKEYKDQPSNKNSKQVDEHGNLIRPKYLSNHTHESKTDGDARISVKPGKARQLNYFGQIAERCAPCYYEVLALIMPTKEIRNV